MKQEKRSEIIHDALNLLDDEMIEEVEKIRGGVVLDKVMASTTEEESKEEQELFVQQEFCPWRKWVALAASVCVLILAGGVWNAGISKGWVDVESENSNHAQGHAEDEWINKDVEIYDKAESEAINSEENVHLQQEEELASDMSLFFIYEGHCYVQTCDYMTKDVVGDYVCTTTGRIDEWTNEDGYVELAGSIAAKFYEVKGIDPEFMLCTVYENDVVETFINNAITLDKGSELLVDRIGLEENYKQVSYLTDREWENQYKTKQKPTVISEEHRELFDRFIDSFNEGDFVSTKSMGMNKDVVYDSDAIYHLYITTQEGVLLHFLLLDNGYVSFSGLEQLCLQVDEGIVRDIMNVLEKR